MNVLGKNALGKQYSRQFRKKLGYHPAWPPGDPVAPGGIGRLKGGIFSQVGTVTDIFADLSYEIREEGCTESMSFCSDSGFSTGVGASGSALVGLEAEVCVSFSHANAVVFHATNLKLRYMDHLYQTMELIARHQSKWPEDLVLVSHVELAERYGVLISQAPGWNLLLKGDASAVANLHIGDASISVGTVQGSGFQRFGHGPVTLRLYGPKKSWWDESESFELLSVDEPANQIPEFIEISPTNSKLDEENG